MPGTPSTAATTASSPAAAPTATSAAATFPLTVTDSGGHVLTLDKAPTRIISHSPGATEILFAIGAGSQVVADDEYSDYPAAAKALKHVKYTDPDPEAELALQPDLVIFATNQKAQVASFRAVGLPVFYNTEPADLSGVLANVRLLGRMTGHVAEADALAQAMQQRIDAVGAKVASVTHGPTVFYELDSTLYTAAPDSFIGGMLSMLKARNIAAGSTTAFPQLSEESVIAASPDVILLADARYGETPAKVAARPGWSAIPAVKNGRIYPIDPDLVNRPGPRIVEGLEMLAKLLYPDRFP